MATAPTTAADRGLTAEAFARRPDPGYPEELVEGRVVAMSPPGARHGVICNRVGMIVGVFADERDLGRVLTNDSGVITRRSPDTVRGADVAYYSYAKLPKGPLPVGYPEVAPDLVVEVRSPGDRWPEVLVKVGEYLGAGVGAVVVLDGEATTAQVFEPEGAVRLLGAADLLELPGVLPGFRVEVRRFFG